jgi:hypothetical protein
MSDPNSSHAGSYSTQSLLDDRAPAVMALRMLHKLITDARADMALKNYAETDLRALDDVQNTLLNNPSDPGAAQWLRQLALNWQTKTRNSHPLKFRRILELVESVKK